MDYGRLCTWCARGCETQRDCVSFDYKALGRLNLRHQNWFLESRFQSHIRARSCDRDECGVYSEVGRSEALELEFGSAKKLLCPACFSSTASSAGEVSCQKDAKRMKQKECHSMSSLGDTKTQAFSSCAGIGFEACRACVVGASRSPNPREQSAFPTGDLSSQL